MNSDEKMINFNLICEIMSSVPNHDRMLKVSGFGGRRDLANTGGRGLV